MKDNSQGTIINDDALDKVVGGCKVPDNLAHTPKEVTNAGTPLDRGKYENTGNLLYKKEEQLPEIAQHVGPNFDEQLNGTAGN